MTSSGSIAIIGAGALGGYYGGRLAQHGHNVHFLLRTDYQYVRQHGLHVRSVDGDFHLPPGQIRVYDDPRSMPKADLVVVTLKSTQNDQLDRLVSPLLLEKTTLLTLQNGLGNEDAIARLFGVNRVLGGIAFVCINRTGPGQIEHLDQGFVRVGEFATLGVSERAASVADLLTRSLIPTQAIENLRYGRWEKLVWNIPFNGLGAVRGLTTDRLIDTDEGVSEVLQIMREVLAAAAADGITLRADLPEKKIAVTRPMGPYRTSTQIDRQQGKPMELEAIFGHPLRVAEAAGVAVPGMRSLYDALRRLEERKKS
jgi:2-dehydropantoate 2-reductase